MQAEPHLQIDNEQVRVTTWSFPPGGATGWHRHDYPYVVVPLATGTLEITTAEAVTASHLVTGVAYHRAAGAEHDVRYTGSDPFAFVEIEIKQ
jgi:beta-alanine degradation protein BauB